MDFDSQEPDSETPLLLNNCQILQYTKTKPLNFAIQQFNNQKTNDSAIIKSPINSKKPENIEIKSEQSTKWDFSIMPGIHEPSSCSTMREWLSGRDMEEKAEKNMEFNEKNIDFYAKNIDFQGKNLEKLTKNIKSRDFQEKTANFSLKSQYFQENVIKCIFQHDTDGLREAIKGSKGAILDYIDLNGNTPLILAVKLAYSHLDYEKIIRFFREMEANPRIRDINGVSALEEALAQGDIVVISMLFDWLVVEKFEKYSRETVEISEKLLQMQDFYLEIKWEFDSFIPFLSKFAPTDVFKIHKIGSSIRLDSNLLDFKLSKRKSRKMSLFFHKNQLHLLNWSHNFYCDIMELPDSEEKQNIIYDLMYPDMKSTKMEILDISIKTEPLKKNCKVSGYTAKKLEASALYQRTNIKKKHKYLSSKLEEYLKNDKNDEVTQEKKKIRRFRQDLNVFLSDEFPLKLKDLEALMIILSRGNKLMRDLKEFLGKNENLKTEISGFPVKVQIPINFAVKAVINFQNFKKFDGNVRNSEFHRDLFQIPDDFSFCDRKKAQKTFKYKSKRLFLSEIFLS